jgi:Tfp pilus assembly protein PilF
MNKIEALRQRKKDQGDRQARILLAQALYLHCQHLEPGDANRLTFLHEARQEDPYNFSVNQSLAFDYHERQQVSQSHHFYLEALRLIPDDSVTLGHHALLLFESYQSDPARVELLVQAKEKFETAHHCDPQLLLPIFGLIDVHLESSALEDTQAIFNLMKSVPVSADHVVGFISRFVRLTLALQKLGPRSLEILQGLSEKLQESWMPVALVCPELEWLKVGVEIWKVPLDSLPEWYQLQRGEIEPGSVVFFLARQRMKECVQGTDRLVLLERMLERRSDDPFLRREQLAMLHLKAKRFLALGDLSEAERIWKGALNLDPHNDRIVQNLALLALARSEDSAIEVYWDRLVSSWIQKGELFSDNDIYLDLLGLYAHLFAERLYKRLCETWVLPGEAVGLADRWLALSIQSVVLRGLAIDATNVEHLRFLVEEDLAGFLRLSLRSLLELSGESLFEAMEKPAPFHYDSLDLQKSASQRELSRAVESTFMTSGSLQSASVQEAVATLNDWESRLSYDSQTLDWDSHCLNRVRAEWLLRLKHLLGRYSSMKMTMFVQLVVFSFDFTTLLPYYGELDPDLYAQTRDGLVEGYCADVLAVKLKDPEAALGHLSEVAGSLDRWTDAHDCCALARIFNEVELIYMSQFHTRSTVNGLAKGIYLLKRAEETANDIETRARILQQFSEIESGDTSAFLTLSSDVDPEIKHRLEMAYNEFQAKNYDQARLRLEALLRKRPRETGAILMLAQISIAEAQIAYSLTSDIAFLEMQLTETLEQLQELTLQEDLVEHFRTPCQRMIWKINGSLAKAREAEAAADS